MLFYLAHSGSERKAFALKDIWVRRSGRYSKFQTKSKTNHVLGDKQSQVTLSKGQTNI